MSSSSEIIILNRESGNLEKERVYGDLFVKFLYQSAPGRLVENFLSENWVSKLYGLYQGSVLSHHKIQKFIQDFQIDMDEFIGQDEYKSFNDFFVRKFKNGKRIFSHDPNSLSAFAEARYLGFDKIDLNQTYPVKGKELTGESLLAHTDLAECFHEGPILIARLCPVDYHRFHFPDDGVLKKFYEIHGQLHSVNPMALSSVSEIYIKNERQVSILETANFGKLAYIEVGALCVGKIVQTHQCFSNSDIKDFKRGDEKGIFLFGGSTVILLGEKNRWRPCKDILENTSKKREVLIKLGQAVGEKLS